MDYLFGGTTALLSQIAARNASTYYEQATYASTQSALIQLAAAGRALKEANKKRSGKTNDFGLSIEEEEEKQGDDVNFKRFVTWFDFKGLLYGCTIQGEKIFCAFALLYLLLLLLIFRALANKNKIGLFANWGEYDFQYNSNINYGMDYLFGGPTAFASRVAANTAAANATKVVFDDTRTQLNTLAALQAAAAGKRRKRLVDLNPLLDVNSVFESSRAQPLVNPRVGGNGKQTNKDMN